MRSNHNPRPALPQSLAFLLLGDEMNKRSFNAPEGDKRLTVNVSKELHQKLKIAAVMAHTTVGELIEKFAKDQLDEMLRKGIK